MLTGPHLAICSWSLQPESPCALIEALKTIGIKRTQIHLNPFNVPAAPAHTNAEVDATRTHVESSNPDWPMPQAAAAFANAGIELISGMFSTTREDYSTLETIRETGGVVPDAVWPENQIIIANAIATARALNLKLISTHIGFIPHNFSDPSYDVILRRVLTAARLCQDAGLQLLLETGQETAADLNRFLYEVQSHGATNIKVNFDPANMILYGKGDPVEALRVLMPRVAQVHIKDAIPSDQPGTTWGTEVPVGTGAVDWPAFLAVLAEAGYDGDLCIEREAGEQRIEDIRTAADVVGLHLA